jgi:hypothetical protein
VAGLAFSRVNEHLMSAVLQAALFFEMSNDDECDPDLAVKQLEEIAWSLAHLSAEEQEQFRAFARRAAESAALATEILSLADRLLPSADE